MINGTEILNQRILDAAVAIGSLSEWITMYHDCLDEEGMADQIQQRLDAVLDALKGTR